MTDDVTIQARIRALIDEERHLRGLIATGESTAVSEQRRLGRLKAELDECTELLHGRGATRTS